MTRSRPALPATQELLDPVRVAGRHRGAQLVEARAQRLDERQDLGAVVEEDVAPHRRAGSRDARRVAQAGRGQPPDPVDDVGRQLAERRRQRVGRDVRQVTARAEHPVVQLGGHAHRLGAERRPQPLDRRDRRLVAPRRRTDHATLSLEQQRAGGVRTDALGAGDRMAGARTRRAAASARRRRSPRP